MNYLERLNYVIVFLILSHHKKIEEWLLQEF